MTNETYNLTTTRYALSGALLGIAVFGLISNFIPLHLNADIVDYIGGAFGFVSVFIAKARHLF